MKHTQSLLFLFLVLLMIPASAHAQAWSGIISSSRAVDWTQAGIPGGIPTRTTICATLGTSGQVPTFVQNVTSAQIVSAISSCTNGIVLLNPGTYSGMSGISFGTKSNVTLRGSGADQTLLVFTSGGAGTYNSLIAMQGSSSWANGPPDNVCDWTAGYTPGTKVITLANCGSTTPAVGSLANLKVGTIIMLDQVDELTDTGQIWNCAEGGTLTTPTAAVCANTVQGMEDRTNGPCVLTECQRSQVMHVTVAHINGSQITLSQPLIMPNWRSGQAPQAWFATAATLVGDGLENMSLDNSANVSGSIVFMMDCAQCWVKGVRTIKANRSHVRQIYVYQNEIRDNYFYANQSGGVQAYGVEIADGDYNLNVNNIYQQITDSAPSCTGPCEANVFAYNLNIYDLYASNNWFISGNVMHAAGDAFNLTEGNVGTGVDLDSVHGTHHFESYFRNYFVGWQQHCQSGVCNLNTVPMKFSSGSRYTNSIANVLGEPGYHDTYNCLGSSSTCANRNTSIWEMGATGENVGVPVSGINGYCLDPGCGSHGDYDPQVFSYSMRWGNYDTVTGGVRWCGNSSDTGWSATCSSISEIPTGLASYSNPVPSYGDTGAGQSAMPASFYYSSKPSWFGSASWPIIGPDVSSGNIGMCSGGTYAGAAATSSSQCAGGTLVTAWGSHANANPAMLCYLNIMGGPPDGTGSVLSFNASTCYGQLVSSQLPASPTNLNAIVQ